MANSLFEGKTKKNRTKGRGERERRDESGHAVKFSMVILVTHHRCFFSVDLVDALVLRELADNMTEQRFK